jgi:hypothetical protein
LKTWRQLTPGNIAAPPGDCILIPVRTHCSTLLRAKEPILRKKGIAMAKTFGRAEVDKRKSIFEIGTVKVYRQREVEMNQGIQFATRYLKSLAFAGCYAMVAEFKQGNEILGMLGHYDPTHIFLFKSDFQSAVFCLGKLDYRLRMIYVFAKDISAGEKTLKLFASVKDFVRNITYSSRFLEYTGELDLHYYVQQRYFTFEKPHNFYTCL